MKPVAKMIVYLIRNRINGKVYVGKTAGRLAARWARHLYSARQGEHWHISCAIRKYGEQNFIVFPLVENVRTRAELSEIERKFITAFGSTDPARGYNLTLGGDGPDWSPEQCRAISVRMAGNKNGIGNKNALGNKMSLEWRSKWKGVRRSPATEIRKGQRLSPNTEFKPQTHWKRGHEFTPENTIIQYNGNKKCRTCHRAIRSRRWHEVHQRPIPAWVTRTL